MINKTVYGYCPICHVECVDIDRNPFGDYTCANGHTYKYSASVSSLIAKSTEPFNPKYWINIDGKQFPNEEAMVAHLLNEDAAFVNTRKYVCPTNNKVQPSTIVVFIGLNDIFAPAADADEINNLPNMFRLYELKGHDGIIEHYALKRGYRPQNRVVENMKNRNNWTPELEKLPTAKEYHESIT